MQGKRETARRELATARRDFVGFLKHTWPLWVLAAAATLAYVLASR